MEVDSSCCVCWQSFLEVDPVVLSACGHTVCKGCAIKLGSESFSGNTTIKCPFCQQPSIYRHKQDIKSNYTLRGLLQSLHSETDNLVAADEVINLLHSNLHKPRRLIVGTKCQTCSWYLALQNKFLCSYCGATFCSKCSEPHITMEQDKYIQAHGEVKQKITLIKASLELQNRSLEARCQKLEQEKVELELEKAKRLHVLPPVIFSTPSRSIRSHLTTVAVAFLIYGLFRFAWQTN